MEQLEQWRDVVGYEGLYQVSNLGRVRSVDRIVRARRGARTARGRILRLARSGGYSYLCVSLSKNGLPRTHMVHRLVAAAWIGPRKQGMQVRHGPAGRYDNSIDNLCYGTASENALDRRRDGTDSAGNKRRVMRCDGREYASLVEAAEESGTYNQNIYEVCVGKRNTAGGYCWTFCD